MPSFKVQLAARLHWVFRCVLFFFVGVSSTVATTELPTIDKGSFATPYCNGMGTTGCQSKNKLHDEIVKKIDFIVAARRIPVCDEGALVEYFGGWLGEVAPLNRKKELSSRDWGVINHWDERIGFKFDYRITRGDEPDRKSECRLQFSIPLDQEPQIVLDEIKIRFTLCESHPEHRDSIGAVWQYFSLCNDENSPNLMSIKFRGSQLKSINIYQGE